MLVLEGFLGEAAVTVSGVPPLQMMTPRQPWAWLTWIQAALGKSTNIFSIWNSFIILVSWLWGFMGFPLVAWWNMKTACSFPYMNHWVQCLPIASPPCPPGWKCHHPQSPARKQVARNRFSISHRAWWQPIFYRDQTWQGKSMKQKSQPPNLLWRSSSTDTRVRRLSPFPLSLPGGSNSWRKEVERLLARPGQFSQDTGKERLLPWLCHCWPDKDVLYSSFWASIPSDIQKDELKDFPGTF